MSNRTVGPDRLKIKFRALSDFISLGVMFNVRLCTKQEIMRPRVQSKRGDEGGDVRGGTTFGRSAIPAFRRSGARRSRHVRGPGVGTPPRGVALPGPRRAREVGPPRSHALAPSASWTKLRLPRHRVDDAVFRDGLFWKTLLIKLCCECECVFAISTR
ncbi:hypothetical protein NL676_031702 [Syzygium grande]|nr:hypothetical protein NL676_031702 [Syzygium grande]